MADLWRKISDTSPNNRLTSLPLGVFATMVNPGSVTGSVVYFWVFFTIENIFCWKEGRLPSIWALKSQFWGKWTKPFNLLIFSNFSFNVWFRFLLSWRIIHVIFTRYTLYLAQVSVISFLHMLCDTISVGICTKSGHSLVLIIRFNVQN